MNKHFNHPNHQRYICALAFGCCVLSVSFGAVFGAVFGIAGEAVAESLPPKILTSEAETNPLTIEFAKATPPPDACKSLMVESTHTFEYTSEEDGENYGETLTGTATTTGRERLASLLEDIDTDAHLSPHSANAKDQMDLIQCQRDSQAYFIFAQVEKLLLDQAEKGASLARAVAAFDLSLQLADGCKDVKKYPHCPKMLAYRANALAQAGRVDDAFASLKQALEAGFRDMAALSYHAGFEHLHDQPDWNDRFSAIVPESIPAISDALVSGLFIESNDDPESRSPDVNSYYLCPENRVHYRKNDMDGSFTDSKGHNMWQMGRWSLRSGAIWVLLEHWCTWTDDPANPDKRGPDICWPIEGAEWSQILFAGAARVYLSEVALDGTSGNGYFSVVSQKGAAECDYKQPRILDARPAQE